ncbi:flagellin hook IN motif-containing protein, partial [Marinobacter sp.]|uniref:flagellin N-terminal helical domain-containing protein n=1 Tax=Marinobacter sp. TaxID=50741 RepID=UPI0034A58DE1
MALGINTNVASLSAQNQLSKSQGLNDQALQRLSSGLRINSAKDDAAGLAISTRFSAQISGSNVAQRNANDGISFAQTAEGALGEITNALSRIRDLAVQSANDTNSASDREALNQETKALIDEVNRIGSATQFNGQNVIDGTLDELVFQVGANAGQTINVSGVDARGSQLGSEVFEGLDGIAQSAIGDLATSDDLTVNGQAIDFTDVTSSADLADAINDVSSASGITASVQDTTTADLGSYTVPPAGGTTLTLNETEIVLAEGATVDEAIVAINAVSDQTGVTAGGDATNFTLSNETGDSIVVESDDATTFGALGTADAPETFDAGIDLSTDVGGSITLGGTEADVQAVFGAGVTVGTAVATKSDVLNDVNVLTRESASSAITTVDKALDDINGIRAELGAVQSRFESTISN